MWQSHDNVDATWADWVKELHKQLKRRKSSWRYLDPRNECLDKSLPSIKKNELDNPLIKSGEQIIGNKDNRYESPSVEAKNRKLKDTTVSTLQGKPNWTPVDLTSEIISEEDDTAYFKEQIRHMASMSRTVEEIHYLNVNLHLG